LTGGQEAAGSSPVIPRKRLCKGNFAKPFFDGFYKHDTDCFKKVMLLCFVEILSHPVTGKDVTKING
jgi:hypothetical protein